MAESLDRRTWLKTAFAAVAAGFVPPSQPPAPKQRPFIMDVHIHLADPKEMLPGQSRAEVLEELYRPWSHVYGAKGEWIRRPADATFTADGVVRVMDRDGIDVAVVMPSDHMRVAQRKEHAVPPTSNDFVAQEVRKHPERLIGICGHDPFRDQWKAATELERMVKEHGFKGMKLYPPYDHFDPGDERLYPLYEKALELGVVLTFHTGWAPWVSAPMKFGHPELLDAVGMRYPGLKVNMAHTGGPTWWREAIIVAARHSSFTIDLSSWCTYPPAFLVDMLNFARDLVGLDRVLFGSEHTLCEPGTFVAELQNINLFAERYHYPPFAEADIDRMLGANAARVYGIEPRKRI